MSDASIAQFVAALSNPSAQTLNVNQGDVLLAVVMTSGTNPYITSFTDTQGNIWQGVVQAIGNSANYFNQNALNWSAWWTVAQSSGPNALSIVYNGGTPSTNEVYYFDLAGVGITSAITAQSGFKYAPTPVISNIHHAQTSVATTTDAVTTVGGGGTGPSSTPDAIQSFPALLISVVRTTGSPTVSAGTGFTQQYASANKLVQYRNVRSGSPQDSTATLSVSANTGIWQLALYAIPTPGLVSAVPTNFSGQSGTYTLTEAVGLNDLILVQWALNNSASAVAPVITGSLTGTYSLAGNASYDTGGSISWGQSWIGSRAAGTEVLTITANASTNGQILVSHWNGFTSPPLLGPIAQTSGTGTAIANSVSAPSGNSLLIANTFSDSSTFSGNPAGWTNTFSGGNATINQNYYQTPAAAGTVNFNGTLNASVLYRNWLLSFYSIGASAAQRFRGPGVSPDSQSMFTARALSTLPVVRLIAGRALAGASAFGSLLSIGAGRLIGYFPTPGPGISPDKAMLFARRPLSAAVITPNLAGTAVALAVARGRLTGSTTLFGRMVAGSMAFGKLTIATSVQAYRFRGPGVSADWPQSFFARKLSDSSFGPRAAALTGRAVATASAFGALAGGSPLFGIAQATATARGNLSASGGLAGRAMAGASAFGSLTAATVGHLQGIGVAGAVIARGILRSSGPFPGPSRFIPPGLGSPVSYQQFSWLELVAQAWGSAFRQPDPGIYQFSGGRRFDSTDQYNTGIYGPAPSVTAPVLSGFASGFTVFMSWQPATIAGSSITAYTLWRSVNGAAFLLLAVLQGSSDDYADVDLAPGSYTYFLVAESAVGTVSPESNQLSVTI